MTARHTPGPWILGETSHDILTRRGAPVASPCDGYDEAQWLVDGLLIATAPELLAALRVLGRPHDGGLCFCELSRGNPMVTKHSPGCVNAQAVIAKAEGR